MNPTQLGPYTITSRLGRGGMGTVFEAVDATTGAKVAVKILSSHLAEDPGLRRRFNAEIDALKSLRHPGIVRLIAFGEQDDQPYFAMELVRGKSLEQLLRGGRRFTWRETVAVAAEIARALKVAHDAGVIHRDLKPANLLVLDPPGDTAAAPSDGPTVKLADFGIAKLFGGAGNTAIGNVVGTVEYMAPEQAAGRPIDQRADLYALGLVMYAMVAGAPPFQGRTLTEIIGMQQRVVPPRLATVAGNVPAEFDELVARLLAKDPAQRPANALALSRLLAAIATLHPPGLGDTLLGRGQPPAAAPRAAERGPTAHDRSERPTQPSAAPHTPPQAVDLPLTRAGGAPPVSGTPARPAADTPTIDLPAADPLAATGSSGGDLTAATGAWTSPEEKAPAAAGTAATGDFTVREGNPLPGAVTARSQPGPRSTGGSGGDRGAHNRFMTVEQLDQITAEQSRRARARDRWLQSAMAAALMAGVPLAVWLAVRPPSADQLHDRIMAVAREYDRARATADRRDDEAVDLRDVRDDVRLFLERHAADPRAEAIRGVMRELDLNALETRVRVLWDDDRKLSPVKQEYLEAVTRRSAAARLAALEAFLEAHAEPAAGADADERLLPALARRTADRLRSAAEVEEGQDPRRAQALLDEAAALEAQAAASDDADLRTGLAAAARRKRQSVVATFGDDPHAREQVDAAKRLLTVGDAGTATASAVPPSPAPSTVTPPPERPRDAVD